MATNDSVKSFTTPTQVQNIVGTSGGEWVDTETGADGSNPYVIANLKQKYIQLSGTQRTTCCAAGCSSPWQATAHVMINDGRKGGGGNRWWLVPACTFHNRSTPVFEVTPNTVFVSVEAVRKM